MRFFTLAAAFLGAASTFVAASPTTSPRGLGSDLEARMIVERQFANLDICANVVLTVPGITIPNPLAGIPGQPATITLLGQSLTALCLCLDGGVLTPQSIARIRANLSLSSNAVLLNALIRILGGTLDTVVDVLAALALPILRDQTAPTGCTYPENAIPDDCSNACGFVCPTTPVLYTKCNNICVLGPTCPTAGPGSGGRKRDATGLRKDLRCPAGFDACAVPSTTGSTHLSGRDYECVQTHRDLESCGGCLFPLPGQSLGVDCTAIAETTSVSCHAGECVINKCAPGFIVNGTSCITEVEAGFVKTGTGRKAAGGDGAFWSALEVLVSRNKEDK